MKTFIMTTWTRFRHCDEGVTLVEYGIAISLAIGLGTVALVALGGNIGGAMDAAGAIMCPGAGC